MKYNVVDLIVQLNKPSDRQTEIKVLLFKVSNEGSQLYHVRLRMAVFLAITTNVI